MSDVDTELGRTIREARTKAKLSLADVADLTSMSKAHIWDMEQGRSNNPTVGTIARLAMALGLSESVLTKAALTDRHASYERGDGL